MAAYAEFGVTTCFSFLRGASHPEEMVEQAAALGLAGIGVADRNSVAGVVRAHGRAKMLGLRFAPGARLVFRDGSPDLLAFPADRAGWGRLCRLLTIGNRRAPKGECHLDLDDLAPWTDGLWFVVMPPARIDAAFEAAVVRIAAMAPGRLRLGASFLYRGDDRRRLARIAAIARRTGVPAMATGDVLYHVPERRPLQDVITCIREHATLETIGRRLEANAERHLKAPAEMERLFAALPGAVEETTAFLARLAFSLDELSHDYPDEMRQGYTTAQEALVALAEAGARQRFPQGLPPAIRHALDHELALIARLDYARYFLTVHEIVAFARQQGILCQGRGSAANSVVCYCLGITAVDPRRVDLLFERFVSEERREPPDIDVDFEHERRETVIQHIYETYGRDRAGLAATVIRYRGRSAIREVGKVFGLSDDVVSILAGTLWGWSKGGVSVEDVRRAGLDPGDPRLAKCLALADQLCGMPRHLSQHVGGFLMTRSRLDEVVPIQNAAMADRTVVEWDKDDLEELRLLKIDVLGLGMLSCLRRSFELLDRHYGVTLTLGTVPAEEPEVYAMLQRADSIGVFQVESRAQMSMLPRLSPKTFYDLVIQVAIVRPGPIQGDMVHPYLRRRQGIETAEYPSEELRAVLVKTLGVPLFQEQAMRIAIVAAGFSPSEADQLRRAMATFRHVGTIQTFERKMIEGMVAKGYARDFAERCFSQIRGFGEYGFPESHAASFALLVYDSAWVKCRYPDVFAAALLNSQPMGFYAPAQIVRDAREHGVEIRPADVNASDWDATLEPGPAAAERLHPRHAEMRPSVRATHALRLGLRQISGLSEATARRIVERRRAGYDSLRDLWLRTGLTPAELTLLAEADAFGSLGLSRRDALWAVAALRRSGDKDDLPLFAAAALRARNEAGGGSGEPEVTLRPMPPGAEVVEDYRTLHLSLRAHPVSFIRATLDRRRIMPAARLPAIRPGTRVTVAGLVLVRQRPGSASGVIFMTLEDETGIANAIIWPRVFETFRPVVLGARLAAIRGRLQNEAGVIHIVAEEVQDLSPALRGLGETAEDGEGQRIRHAMPRGRNFH